MTPDISPDDPRLPSRPLWGIAILALPIVGILALFIAYAVMWSLGLAGRSASGEVVEVRFKGCPEARPLLEARLTDMGLQGTWSNTPDGYMATFVPTGDPDVDGSLPATLSAPAALEVRGGDEVLATNRDLADASVRMDLFMVSYVLLELEPDAAERVKAFIRAEPHGKIRFHVDGVDIGWQSNTNPVAVGDLEINPDINDELERMRAVAAWSVTLDHAPLPCPVTPSALRQPAR